MTPPVRYLDLADFLIAHPKRLAPACGLRIKKHEVPPLATAVRSPRYNDRALYASENEQWLS